MSYRGLNDELRDRVLARDRHRCRWCGRTNQGGDVHHIRYRRAQVDDAEWNLITLCRECHNFVHGERINGRTIPKREAQRLLYELVESPGLTGMALVRKERRSSSSTSNDF